MNTTLIDLFETSILENRTRPAFSDYMKGDSAAVTYGQVALRTLAIHELFAACGIQRGSKVAVLGKNSANWATAYLATLLYGAVVVPILPEFKPEEIFTIIEHSDAHMLFCADDLFQKCVASGKKISIPVISLKDFRPLSGLERGSAKAGRIHTIEDDGTSLTPGMFGQKTGVRDHSESLASIVYTSGTTGFSKGVMLPMRSLMANVVFAQENMPLKPGDTILSFLPTAHAFGCAFEFLFPFANGCHITFLDRMPSPTILLKAFSDIRPRLILSVPLIFEKIYSSRVKPLLNGKAAPLFKLPLVKNLLNAMLRKKLHELFGGNFIQIIIGGAALNPEVENFLHDIGFRYTVGYGMTECGPLISYAGWDSFKKYSVGRSIDTLEIRIDSDEPSNIAGEIMVKGANVMLGYYKNEKETRSILTEEGWLRTGDLGVFNDHGNIFIRGRKKTMLLGSSGQNIYPEEIEARLNTMPFVEESLVVQRGNRLTALVFPSIEQMKEKNLDDEALAPIMEKNRKALNAMVSSYSTVSKIEIVKEEFEKTPSKKIKRFLYS
ncbi:AMP-binding protein [Desulfatitalea tepidiphila]|uniref:AMP-binding protein n=1 Tax=Desulfatitalea tepidiphila TaxID=1185843 RepID=UPI0006B64BB9|nr:AMP-binding protein [Desulfatitalea tepidiphila]